MTPSRRAAGALLWCPTVAIALFCVPAPATAQTGPVIEDGQTQVVPAFADSSAWIRHELWVETEFDTDGDGRPDRVHVDVTRPPQTDSDGLKVPVIYETSPYYSGVAGIDLDHFWNLRQEVGGEPPARDPFPATIAHRASQPVISNSQVRTWVPRGFAVIHSQSPGTGQSQGCPTVGGANESLAPKAVIDWLNGRARGFTSLDGDEEVQANWATGKVGMTGTSYNGTLPLAAATTGVEGLEAIIPIAPNTSYYHYYRSNGLVRAPGGYPGEDIDVLFDFIFSSFPDVRDYCIAAVRDEMTAQLDRTTGDYNDFWEGRDYLNHIDGVRAAHPHEPRFQRLERHARAQLPHLDGAEGTGRAGPDLLPPGRPRRAPTAGTHEPVVHALRRRRRERRRGRRQGLDRARGRRPGGTDAVSELPAPRSRGRVPSSGRRRALDRHAFVERRRRRRHRRDRGQLLLRGWPTRRGGVVEPPAPLRDPGAAGGRAPVGRRHGARAGLGGHPGGEPVRLAGVAPLDRTARTSTTTSSPRAGPTPPTPVPTTSRPPVPAPPSRPGSSSSWSSRCSPTTRSSPPGRASA